MEAELKLKLNDPAKAREFFEKKMTFTTGPVELDYAKSKGMEFNLIDVRADEDYNKEHIPGAKSLPEDNWESLAGLEKGKLNVIYCYSVVCHLAARASMYFASRGYSVMELDGGFQSWKENGLETERGAAGPEREREIA